MALAEELEFWGCEPLNHAGKRVFNVTPVLKKLIEDYRAPVAGETDDQRTPDVLTNGFEVPEGVRFEDEEIVMSYFENIRGVLDVSKEGLRVADALTANGQDIDSFGD